MAALNDLMKTVHAALAPRSNLGLYSMLQSPISVWLTQEKCLFNVSMNNQFTIWGNLTLMSFERTGSIVLVLVIEVVLVLGIVFDWVWFFGLELSMFAITTMILTLVIWSITALLLFLHNWFTSYSWKKTEWGLNFMNKPTRRKLLILLLILGSLLMLTLSWDTRDLNEVYHIERNNSERHFLMVNETNWVFYTSRVINATSDSSASVYVWVDLSYFENATDVIWAYYNGTNESEGANRTTDQGYPYLWWWTDHSYLWYSRPENETLFGNFTHRDHIPFSIPAQKANTTVEYMVYCRTQNGTNISYIMMGGNFTVLYSPPENENNALLITQSHFLTGLSLILLVVSVTLYESIVQVPQEDFSLHRKAARAAGIIGKSADNLNSSEPIPALNPPYPSTQELVLRSDRLDDVKNSHRIMSGAFIGLSVAFSLYLQDQGSIASFFQWVLLSVTLAIIFNLYILAISLGDYTVKIDGKEVSYDLLPSVGNEDEFRFLVYMRTRKQLSIINKMRKPMQIGVFAILCGVIADFGKVFLIQSDVINANLLARNIFLVASFFMAVTVVLTAWWILNKMGASYSLPE